MSIWIGRRRNNTSGSGTYTGVSQRTIGGINNGQSFVDATMQEMWDALLKNEQFPALTPPSSTFVSSISGLREVGEIVSITFNSTFDRGSISPQYTAASPFRSGLPNAYQYLGSGLPSSFASTALTDSKTITGYTIVLGNQSWSGRVAYDAGVQPKSSLGNNYSTPLSAGTTAYVSASIEGVYPIFATTSSITTLTKQPLYSHGVSYVEVTMVAESGGEKHKIEFADAWPAITGIEMYNPMTMTWNWLNGSKVNSLTAFTQSSVSNVVQSITVPYTRFTHNGLTVGSRQLRFHMT